MDVFALRQALVSDFRRYAESFLTIRDGPIREHVEREFDQGLLWPEPPLQLNPAFESGGTIGELIAEDLLHPECSRIFRAGKAADEPLGREMQLHLHQTQAVLRSARPAMSLPRQPAAQAVA